MASLTAVLDGPQKLSRPAAALALLLLSAPQASAQDCNCSPVAQAGSDLPVTSNYNIGLSPGQFTFNYATYTQQDRIIVSNAGEVLFDTGCVGAIGSLDLSYTGPGIITVQVIPNCLGGFGTAWDYSLNWCAFYTPPTCTPTPTRTATLTQTPTVTLTFTRTQTPTMTLSSTRTETPTRTPTPTRTQSSTQTVTFTRTATFTRTTTPTVTPTPTFFIPTIGAGTPVDPCDFFIITQSLFRPAEGPVTLMVGQCVYPGKYSLKVYNSAGEQVRTLDEGNLTGFWNRIYPWDGRNQRGEDCASGVYLLHLVGPDTTKIGRVMLIR